MPDDDAQWDVIFPNLLLISKPSIGQIKNNAIDYRMTLEYNKSNCISIIMRLDNIRLRIIH